ncbi:MAG: sulfatase-like hydrolase/transferase [Bacteroidota bacterium]
MNKLIIFFLLVTAGCSSSQQESESEPARPNIVLIMVDDLGKEWVSAYGAEDISTPHIDALAQSGVRFNHFYVMPQCTPTRLSILTGQYPFRHGWVNHWDVPRWGGKAHFDERRNPSLGLELKKAGYNTCIAGKWQIDDFRVEPDALTRNGFDAYCMWTGYETGIPASAERYQEPYIFTKDGSKTYEGAFGPDVFTDYIISFIQEQQEKPDPFFIYYPMVLTHTPFVDTPDEEAEDKLGKHKAMVRYTDKLTGKIVQALEEAKLRNNTLIIWMTDNGTSRAITGSYQGRQLQGAKMRMVEHGMSVPCIMSWPNRLAAATTSDALIDITDFFPTFLDLAGISPRKEWQVGDEMQTIDGHSFKEVVMNRAPASNRSWIMSMGGGNHAQLSDKGVENKFRFRDRALRNLRYKLYIDTQGKAEKFFDMQEDPGEGVNLMDSLNTAERKENFEALLAPIATFPTQDNDPRYIPNPAQSWDVEQSVESQSWKQ